MGEDMPEKTQPEKEPTPQKTQKRAMPKMDFIQEPTRRRMMKECPPRKEKNSSANITKPQERRTGEK